MRIQKSVTTAALLLAVTFASIQLFAQNRGAAQTPPAAPAAGYPQRPLAAPEVIERGRMLYSTTCAFCHGNDARGGEGGSNLIRSEIVLNDDKGEAIAKIVRNGIAEMPKFEFTDAQLEDLAAFIHSFRVAGYDQSRMRPATIVVGDAKAGAAYFQSKCSGCHEVTGDIKNFVTRSNDPRTMQQSWLMPGGRGGNPNLKPTTVTVTIPSGEKIDGRLVRIDDFIVTLADADARQRTFRRNGDVPKVEVHDPLEPHRELLRVYTDKDIHNVTAYLEGLK